MFRSKRRFPALTPSKFFGYWELQTTQGIDHMIKFPPRKAYNITLRCRLNGTEWTARLWVNGPGSARDAIYRRARLHMTDRERALGPDWFYVTVLELAADQSRPIG
jgi:hypothetical protein